jgi:cell division protein FtsW
VVALLCGIGLMMVLSASSVEALRTYGGAWLFFERQAMWVGLGVVALIVTASVDYRRWRRLGAPLTAVSLVLLVLVLIPGMGISVGGSSRWLGIGQWRFQPSELAKLAVLLFAAESASASGGSSPPSWRSSRSCYSRPTSWPARPTARPAGPPRGCSRPDPSC